MIILAANLLYINQSLAGFFLAWLLWLFFIKLIWFGHCANFNQYVILLFAPLLPMLFTSCTAVTWSTVDLCKCAWCALLCFATAEFNKHLLSFHILSLHSTDQSSFFILNNFLFYCSLIFIHVSCCCVFLSNSLMHCMLYYIRLILYLHRVTS